CTNHRVQTRVRINARQFRDCASRCDSYSFEFGEGLQWSEDARLQRANIGRDLYQTGGGFMRIAGNNTLSGRGPPDNRPHAAAESAAAAVETAQAGRPARVSERSELATPAAARRERSRADQLAERRAPFAQPLATGHFDLEGLGGLEHDAERA